MNFWQRSKIASSILLKGTSTNPALEPKSRPAFNGKGGSLFKGFANSNRDWVKEAGNLADNSAVAVLLNCVANNFADAPLIVKKHVGDGNYEVQPDHPLAQLMKRPNKSWTRTQLFRAIVGSLKLNGNCYIYKARNTLGTPVELWWLPHNLVTVKTSDKGEVTGFEYKVGSDKTTYKPEDIIHLKLGVDEDQPWLGKAPARSVLREIAIDNETPNYTYALLKNMGLPGVIMSPKTVKSADGDDDTVIEIPKTLPEKMKSAWRALTQGDNRGEPLVLTTPWDITVPGFKPSELLLPGINEQAETRIAGAFDVPVVVVQFLSGLRNVNAKASYGESIQQLYGCCLIPLQRLVCEWLDLQLLPEFGDAENEHCAFDRSEIAALQENVSDTHKRADDGWTAGTLKRSEARAMKGLVSDDALDDIYIYEVQGGAMGAAPMTADVSRETNPADDPVPVDASGAPEAGVVTTQTLNGAQITAALAVVEQIRLGYIPVEVAVELLVAVGIPRDRAQIMADAVEVQPAPEPASNPAPTPAKSLDATDPGDLEALRVHIATYWRAKGVAV